MKPFDYERRGMGFDRECSSTTTVRAERERKEGHLPTWAS
jgi:hypothetical protein